MSGKITIKHNSKVKGTVRGDIRRQALNQILGRRLSLDLRGLLEPVGGQVREQVEDRIRAQVWEQVAEMVEVQLFESEARHE